MYEQSKYEIIDILSNFKEPQTSTSIALQLGISEKTTRKYLNILKTELESHGASLTLKQGSGCVIVVHDQKKYNEFISNNDKKDIFNLPESRKVFVITKLALTKEPINIYEMADEMFLSPSSLRNCIHSLKPQLSKYNLELYHSHNHGYMIKGTEDNIRRCLTSEWGNHPEISDTLDDCNFKTTKMRTIYDIVKDTLNSYSISISDDGISSLAMHILMAINRNETKNEIVIENTENWVKSSPEYFISNSINHKLTRTLGFTLSENELYYLTLHLNGKPRDFEHEQLRVKINSDALTFYNKFLRKILLFSDIDFFEDKELRTSLLNHIVPFLNRLKNKMQINKSALPNIKAEFPYAYDLSLIGLSCLEKRIFDLLTQEEISYFALHIALALEKQNEDVKNLSVVILGLDNSNLFKINSFKLNKEFEDYINSITMLNIETFKTLENKERIDLVLNASNTIVESDIPTIKVHKVMDDGDIDNINKAIKKLVKYYDITSIIKEELFFEIDASSKEDLLRKQVDLISKYYVLPENYYESILEREKMTSTAYDNGVAVPHSLLQVDDVSFISVVRLKKAINWDNKKVQLVFLICTHDSQKLTRLCFSKISKVISNSDTTYQLLNANSFKDFINTFNSN